VATNSDAEDRPVADQSGKSGAAREEFREGAGKAGPSSSTDSRGLEGSILEEDKDSTGASSQRTSASAKSTGAGSEAAEGMHATEGRSQADKSALTNRATGREGSGESDRNASEPMDRTKEHKGSYGGEGGSPRTSSDQRESHGKGGGS
jgi:hypothetical protein